MKGQVSESLLLMKFYCLTQDVANYLLSSRPGCELSLPSELTQQEQEIVLFPKSSFILGRSGTGKTTILTMKLSLRERQFHEAMYGSSALHNEMGTGADLNHGPEENNDRVLRQLFVTVSSKLCFSVHRHVSQLQSFARGGIFEAEDSSITNDLDDMALFKGIPDNFKDVPFNMFPLIITFHKFLTMLDGTIGDSYFDRFPCKLGLQSLIKAKEVTYDKFCEIYWPRFSERLTRKLDASRVFTEIISHIKGGERSGDGHVGVLSRGTYLSLSEGRVSMLSSRKRDDIYDIYEDYEKLKMTKDEFDLADLVNDLHSRIGNEPIKDVEIDFVYVNEVQDLTMSQILLFKYICRNVEDGFMFSGDTAQTIARGIDFRFEDIRSLFYKEFLIKSREMQDVKMEKGQLSKCFFHLNQNFRTHDGILKLAQSIVDLLYHYFPSAVDVLSPETSQICGESPVILVSESHENAIMSIFGNSRERKSKFVGFGAEQVILVRDDRARSEVLGVVRGQALVLTIMECKGLEFQDVLLYDFFGTSPLKSRWRVVYEYMKGRDLLNRVSLVSSPSFDEEKHSILCSELKQLYVAVTRTRQRLWICENCDDSSEPIFDYWKSLCLVQTRTVDINLADAMQVPSTSEQWKTQGFKLLREGNYPMAILCFERAEYAHGEKLAKASGLKAYADLKHASSPQEARGLRRQAAEIFEAIGERNSAEECYRMLEHEGFLAAAAVARMEGHILHEAEILGKGKYFKRASLLILKYVLAQSLWGNQSQGWPLKSFPVKEELLKKAASLAKSESDAYFQYIEAESRILMGERKDFAEINDILSSSKRCANLAGEILCFRSLIDCHFLVHISTFNWENHLVVEQQMSAGQMSSETLFFVWNCWKDLVVKIIQCIRSSKAREEIAKEEKIYWEFCLDYLGIIEECENGPATYLIRYESADWCRSLGKRCQRASFTSAADKYWCAELATVGMNVTKKLMALFLSQSIFSSNFCKFRCPIRMFEAASFLLEARFVNPSDNYIRDLKKFVDVSSLQYYERVFPEFWFPLTKIKISLRETGISRRILAHFVTSGSLAQAFSGVRLGQIVVLVLGSSHIEMEFQESVGKYLKEDSPWGILLKHLIQKKVGRPTFPLIWSLHKALEATTENARDYKSCCVDPFGFIYLVDRFVFLLSCAKGGHFLTTRSSLAEFLICHGGEFHLSGSITMDRLQSCINFMGRAAMELLRDPSCIEYWFRETKLGEPERIPSFLLKFILMMCAFHLNNNDSSGAAPCFLSCVLNAYRALDRVCSWLCSTISQLQKEDSWKIKAGILAGAYRIMDDPLVLVSFGDEDCSSLVDPDTIFLDTRANTTKDDIMKVLFPDSDDSVDHESSDKNSGESSKGGSEGGRRNKS